MSIRTVLSHVYRNPNQAFCTAMLAVVAAVWLAAPAIGQEAEFGRLGQEEVQERILSDEKKRTLFEEIKRQKVLESYRNRILQQQEQIQELHQQLQQLHATHEEKMEGRQLANLPPLEDGTLQVFHLKNIDPSVLAETLDLLLGPNQLRLVPDAEHGTLLAYAEKESMRQISEMIVQLDATSKSTGGATDKPIAGEPQLLMVRIFWLADGLPEGEGTHAMDYLPQTVVDAFDRLGLREPRLVSQSSASVVIGSEGEVSIFQFDFPAIVHGKLLQFQSHGQMILEGQPRIQLRVAVPGKFELEGRVSAPLGHYMVLGTANYVAEKHVGKRVSLDQPIRFSTSRFACVVQVIEAESFAPDGE